MDGYQMGCWWAVEVLTGRINGAQCMDYDRGLSLGTGGLVDR